MKKLIKIFIMFVIIFTFVFVVFLNKKNSQKINLVEISIGDIILSVELKTEPVEQARGLSGREFLKEKESMLFVFPEEARHPFWMKDMNFPIDIIFFNKDKEIIYIKENALPESYPETFGGEYDSKYILEVIAGFSEKYNLKVGDKFFIQD